MWEAEKLRSSHVTNTICLHIFQLSTFSDGATVISVDPQGGVDRPYGSRDTELRCRGDANPPPQYRWVRQSAAGAVTLGHEAALRLGELRYEDQGEYYCEVTNQIASSRWCSDFSYYLPPF